MEISHLVISLIISYCPGMVMLWLLGQKNPTTVSVLHWAYPSKFPKSNIAVLFLEGCWKSAWSPTALHEVCFLAFNSNNLETCTSNTRVSSSVIIAAWQYRVINIAVWFSSWVLFSKVFISFLIWSKWQQLQSVELLEIWKKKKNKTTTRVPSSSSVVLGF